MCGIVGYVGSKPVVPLIINGLRKLEYRGYDSAGLAVISGGAVSIRRTPGKLSNLVRSLEEHPLSGNYGIGHTRWATHGKPTEENAHPHRDCTGSVIVVHNGIIENYLELKHDLLEQGHRFTTETDTEVIAHLVESLLPGKSFEEASREALKQLRGSYAVCMLHAGCPDTIITARSGPPLILGIGDNELLVASDVPALLEHTREMYFMKDGEMAVLSPAGLVVQSLDGKRISPATQQVEWSPEMAEKGGFSHFMLKEIFEQPRCIQETLAGRISLDSGRIHLEEANLGEDILKQVERIHIVACGTSWHAGLVGKFFIEELARIPVEIDYGSEFRYRDPLVDAHSLVIAISQSGETADTLAAVREARVKKARVLSICNVVGSMLSRESHGTLYIRSGPEIGVASTKAFTCQLMVLLLVALYMAQKRNLIEASQVLELVPDISKLPENMRWILSRSDAHKEIAQDICRYTNALYLGRGIHYPIALEGALKLKEISYIHAEGYPAGEMKHGPNALIDRNLPVVALAAKDGRNPKSVLRYEKMVSNIEEVRAREGILVVLANENDDRIQEIAEHVIPIPQMSDYLLPVLMSVPLQLLAYHIAVLRGCDVDQPRNLAKSVTVE